MRKQSHSAGSDSPRCQRSSIRTAGSMPHCVMTHDDTMSFRRSLTSSLSLIFQSQTTMSPCGTDRIEKIYSTKANPFESSTLRRSPSLTRTRNRTVGREGTRPQWAATSRRALGRRGRSPAPRSTIRWCSHTRRRPDTPRMCNPSAKNSPEEIPFRKRTLSRPGWGPSSADTRRNGPGRRRSAPSQPDTRRRQPVPWSRRTCPAHKARTETARCCRRTCQAGTHRRWSGPPCWQMCPARRACSRCCRRCCWLSLPGIGRTR
jgi:hypothetical protein